MRETRWDCIDWVPPNLPVDLRPSIIDSSEPRLEGGSNIYVTQSGTIKKRWGSTQWSNVLGTTKRVVKTWLYETLPIPTLAQSQQYSYIILCVKDTGTSTYGLYSLRYDATTATIPSSVTALRQSNSSEKPHIIVFSKGLAYVTGFPSDASAERYGTIILDGSSGSLVVRPWGLPGPTVPARISGETIRLTAAVTATATTFNTTTNTPMPATPYDLWIGYEKVTVTAEPTSTSLTVTRGAGGTTAEAHDANEPLIYRDWDASDHKVDVRYGWKYAFAYVSVTGQISNRSDVEYNPDLMPSNTGPFVDLIPKIDLTLDSWFYNDTTTYPYLNMYRTTDGGGTFYFLEQVTNPGTSTLTYEDDSFGTGASSTTYNDPVPDLKLDTARYAPSLTSNSVPTTVIPPGVVGTNQPSQSVFAIATYASRIWKGIDHYIFFSSREETRDGTGEECFPSGNLGNFFILDAGIVGMAATKETLYIITTNDIYKITGTTLDTFALTKIVTGIGGLTTKDCAKAFRDNVAFITKERQLAIITGDSVRIVSRPVNENLVNTLTVSGSGYVGLEYFRSEAYEWIMIFAGSDTGSGAVINIYDITKSEETGKDFWQCPWNIDISSVACFNSVRSQTNGIFIGVTSGGYTLLCKMSVTDAMGGKVDYLVNSGTGAVSTTSILSTGYFGPVKAPAGNHINALNRPAKDINFYGYFISCTNGGGDFVTVSLDIVADSSSSAEASVTAVDEPRIDVAALSGQYTTYFYPYNLEVKQVTPSFGSGTFDFEILGITFVFDPKANP